MDYVFEQLSIYNEFADSGDADSVLISISTLGTFNNRTDTYVSSLSTYSTFCLIGECKQEDWDQIILGDKVLKIPAYGLPRLDDLEDKKLKITQGGKVFTPAQIKIIEPGGTALLYIIQIRRHFYT